MRWSAKSAKHDEQFAEREWRKAKPVRIGAGSLIWMARQLGWSPASTQLVSGDGDDVGQTPSGLVWVHMSGGKTPRPLASLENFEVLSNYLGVSYSMDVMTGQEIIVVPGLKVAEGTEANSAVTHMMSQAIIAGLPHALVPDFMSMLCAKNPFHPARIWVESKAWDGTSRLAAWYATIQAKDGQALKERMMRKWAISCIAALFKHGGVSAHGVLTLLGDQGIGKTSWLLNLVPRGLGFAKDGMILRPDSPDSVRQVTSAWLVELGELDATFRKSDIAALKAFITQDSDTYRLPYARKNTVNPRRTVFFASVNDVKFLSDSTGNRRYWTIDCENINYQHDIDMQQLWAEVKVLFDNGENWYLDNEELLELNDSNEQFMSVDPVVERLETRLEWGADGLNWAWKTATEIAQMVGIENPNRGDATRIAVHLQKVKGCTRNRSHGVSKILVPPKIQENWF
jgi:putative DNA primase/helicase